MMRQGQSGQIHMLPEAGPFWLVQCPSGMLPNGRRVRRFNDVLGFDAYIRQVRAMGYHTVRYESPFCAVVERIAK